jgi:hypothetical protein
MATAIPTPVTAAYEVRYVQWGPAFAGAIAAAAIASVQRPVITVSLPTIEAISCGSWRK